MKKRGFYLGVDFPTYNIAETSLSGDIVAIARVDETAIMQGLCAAFVTPE